MSLTVTEYFDFLECHPEHVLERHEVALSAFTTLRRSIRGMRTILLDGGFGNGCDISSELRLGLMEWLTAPVHFDGMLHQVLRGMGSPEAVGRLWGDGFRRHFDAACAAAQEISGMENPLRSAVAERIQALHSEGAEYRIFCHRKSCRYFESLSEEFALPDLPQSVFLHSLTEYRRSNLFDCLIKVGPLRSRGWGGIPDAVLTAPRFGTLFQAVWSGCPDEPGFGFDPVVTSASPAENFRKTDDSTPGGSRPGPKWTVKSKGSPESLSSCPESLEFDEFDNAREVEHLENPQPAILVEVSEDQGILYSHHSRVLTIDTASLECEYRYPGDLSGNGMLVCIPLMDTESHAENGEFSLVWKEKLDIVRQRDSAALENRLWDAGLLLLLLSKRIEYWCKPPDTVIQAPQQKKHFRILVEELGIDFPQGDPRKASGKPWWAYAWDEIRHSRGEAIKSGTIAQQDLLKDLMKLKEKIQLRLSEGGKSFRLAIPPGSTTGGSLCFFHIDAVEDGFLAPRAEFGVLCELKRINQWRV